MAMPLPLCSIILHVRTSHFNPIQSTQLLQYTSVVYNCVYLCSTMQMSIKASERYNNDQVKCIASTKTLKAVTLAL